MKIEQAGGENGSEDASQAAGALRHADGRTLFVRRSQDRNQPKHRRPERSFPSPRLAAFITGTSAGFPEQKHRSGGRAQLVWLIHRQVASCSRRAECSRRDLKRRSGRAVGREPGAPLHRQGRSPLDLVVRTAVFLRVPTNLYSRGLSPRFRAPMGERPTNHSRIAALCTHPFRVLAHFLVRQVASVRAVSGARWGRCHP